MNDALEAKLRRAGLVLAWEAGWRLAWPLPAWLALFAAVVLLDLLPLLPSLWHGLGLAGFALGLLLLLARLRHFRWPTRHQRQRRLERDSGLAHHPLSQLEDRPAGDSDDQTLRALWRLQRQRTLALVARLRLAPPAPGLPRLDPLGLRFAPLLLLAIGLAVGRHDVGNRIVRAFDPGFDASVPPPLLQLWITPPAYTGQPPRLLQNDGVTDAIKVPAGSAILIELQGATRDARLEIDDRKLSFTRLDSQSQRLETTLSEGHRLAVRAGWHRLASWPIEVVTDRPPKVAFAAPPRPVADGSVTVALVASDDYAVVRLGLLLSRQDQPDISSEIALSGGGQAQLSVSQRLDLTASPWSGLLVSMRPFAEDGAQQRGIGESATLVLPERQFHHPVARAIAELRRALARAAVGRPAAIDRLEQIADRPDDFAGDVTVFLQLTTARSRLRSDFSPAAVPSVLDMLWAAAMRIEQGDLPDARDAVDQASQALADALAKGASDAEIGHLTDQLNQAMRALLDSLAKRSAPQSGTKSSESGSRALTAEQLQAMFGQMRDLAQAGARQAAQQSLRNLRELLDRLDAGGTADPMAQQLRDKAQQLQQLSERQRALLDRAFRRNGSGDKRQAQADAKAEESLQGQLQQLRKGVPTAAAAALDQAVGDMGQAGQALREDQNGEAMAAEGRALDKMQESARQLEDALAQLGSGSGGAQDPFGRALSQGPGLDGGNVKIPSQAELGKSREILDELRRRAGDAERPAAEHDYLRRLLDKLY